MASKVIKHLSAQEIIEFNILSIDLIKSKKADKSEILSYQKIREIVSGCEELDADIYGKAAYILKSIIKKHAFASGNRRTAFIATKHFVLTNGGEFRITDEPEYAKIMTGIRENYYTDDEIINWIKDGSIRKFERR